MSYIVNTFTDGGRVQYSELIQSGLRGTMAHMVALDEPPAKRIKVQVSNLEVNDLIRAAAKHDPLRANPVTRKLLETPWEDLEAQLELYENTLDASETESKVGSFDR